MHHYKDVINKEHHDKWSLFSKLSDLEMVLFGGTAIAFHLGNRTSSDFDFFTHKSFTASEMSAKLRERLPFLSEYTLFTNEDNALIYKNDNGDECCFFGNMRFGYNGTPVTIDAVPVASVLDLFAYKLNKITRRHRESDYEDVKAFLAHGIPMDKGINAASFIFGKDFNPQNVLQDIHKHKII